MANLQAKPELVDVVIVGCGPGGAVLAKELGESGLSVVVLEAGRRFEPTRDYITDQPDFPLRALKLFQHADDPRANAYTSEAQQGFFYNRVKGVGGSTLHYWGHVPRFHMSDFRTYSEDGVGDDWPINYDELERYYSQVEYELGVSGPSGDEANPFEAPRSRPFPNPPHKMNCAGRAIKHGADKLGWHWRPIPIAIPTRPWGGRPACIRAGACGLGCRIRAKSSADVTYVPKAEATGLVKIRAQCQAREIVVGDDGKAKKVIYFDAAGHEREIYGRAICVAGNAIETPRLLLLSTSSRFSTGLANSSGLVGKRFMEHVSIEVQARFDERMDPWEGPVGTFCQDFYDTKKQNSYARGWQMIAETGHRWPQSIALEHHRGWGSKHKARLKQLIGYTFGVSALGEQLPDVRNRVELDPKVKDHRGLPVPRIVYALVDNDRAMLKAMAPVVKELLRASGAAEIFEAEYKAGWSSHYVGTCRMGMDPRTSVVDAWCRTHDVKNLFLGDGSVFVTSAAANPSLTIQALATRTAEGIVNAFRRGEL
jgi:choline dehydrogenase-like flavoprotein